MSIAKLWSALLEFVYEASEDELDEALRSVGEDPAEVLKRAHIAIHKALQKYDKDKKHFPVPEFEEPPDVDDSVEIDRHAWLK